MIISPGFVVLRDFLQELQTVLVLITRPALLPAGCLLSVLTYCREFVLFIQKDHLAVGRVGCLLTQYWLYCLIVLTLQTLAVCQNS